MWEVEGNKRSPFEITFLLHDAHYNFGRDIVRESHKGISLSFECNIYVKDSHNQKLKLSLRNMFALKQPIKKVLPLNFLEDSKREKYLIVIEHFELGIYEWEENERNSGDNKQKSTSRTVN